MPANPFQDASILSFVDLGSETLLNVETTSNQQNASLAILSNGNFVVAWESNLQDGSGLGVYARMFTADGVALTGDLQMNVTTANNQASPQVVELDNGRAMVIWTSGGDIWYRLIEADGTSPAGEFQINGTTSASNYDVSLFENGDFMVTWEATDGVMTSSGVFGQRFAFNGNEAFPEFRINDAINGAQQNADTASLQSNTVFTVFQSQGQTGTASDQGVYLRNYSNTSTLAGSDILVADAVGELETNPQIEALDGGGFAVSWVNSTTGELWAQTFLNTGAAIAASLTNISGAIGVNTLVAPVMQALPGNRYVVVWEDDATFGRDLYYRVLEADGTTVTTGLLNTDTTGLQTQAQVQVLPQGGFITVFSSGTGPALDVYIVRHAEDGTPAGPALQVEYPVNTTLPNTQTTPDVAVTDDGEIIVTWQSTGQDGSGLGVYMQRFESPEIGTVNDDLLEGDADANFLAGWTGDDTLEGFEGADRLDGGTNTAVGDTLSYAASDGAVTVSLAANTASGGHAEGDSITGFENLIGSMFADTLLGSVVNNTLEGGGGNDTIEGNDGADVLRGDAGADVLRGEGGNDVLSGGTENDVLNGDDGDDVLFAGAGNDLAFGGAGFDRLFGGAGTDRLFGGADNDIANGGADNDIINTGAGNDLVFAQNGNDLVFAQAGNDNIFGGAGNDKLFGGLGGDDINGGAGNDEIFGGAGADLITGAAGHDVMSGGGDTDTFFLFANQGSDRITDYTGADRLDISSFGLTDGMGSDQDWRDATTSVGPSGGGANVTISWDGGGSLTIENIGVASLTDADFVF